MDRSLDLHAASSRQERSVKIDSYGTDIRSAPTLDRVGRPATLRGNADPAGAAPGPAGDEVRLSSDAQLMQAAMTSAQQVPDVRQDVVERMQAALAKGEVGNDPHALADALIDRMLGTDSQKQP
jgi:flagellar biosynthesis anti-sigma factor FlgM